MINNDKEEKCLWKVLFMEIQKVWIQKPINRVGSQFNISNDMQKKFEKKVMSVGYCYTNYLENLKSHYEWHKFCVTLQKSGIVIRHSCQ